MRNKCEWKQDAIENKIWRKNTSEMMFMMLMTMADGMMTMRQLGAIK